MSSRISAPASGRIAAATKVTAATNGILNGCSMILKAVRIAMMYYPKLRLTLVVLTTENQFLTPRFRSLK